MELTEYLLSKEIVVIAAGIVAALHFAGLIPFRKRRLGQTRVWSKLLPVLPMLLGVGAVLLPGVVALGDGHTVRSSWGNLVLLGVWAGLVASQGRKVFKRGLVDTFNPADKGQTPRPLKPPKEEP